MTLLCSLYDSSLLFKQALWQLAARLDSEVSKEWVPAGVPEVSVFQLAVREDISLRMHRRNDAVGSGAATEMSLRLVRYWMAGQRHFSSMKVATLCVDATNLGRQGKVALMLNSPDNVAMVCPPQATVR